MKILVSRLKFIGDIVLTTPVIEVLREKFSDAAIDYLGDNEGVTLLQNNPGLNEIIPYDFSANEIKEQFRVVSVLRKKKYDVAIDLFGNPRSAIAIFLSGAKMRIGGNFGWRRKTYTHPIAIAERLTAVNFHLRYLRPLGINENYRRPKIFVTQDEEEVAAKYLTSLGIDGSQIKIGFHIGATWPAKVWLPDYFAKIAELVIKKYDAQLLVTYGQKDFQYLGKFSSAIHVKFTPIAPQKLRRLAAIISRCDVYISNDAAPMHISAAVGTPTIGIFGPGDPDIWFPYEKNLGHIALHKNIQCCHRDYCQLRGEDYMRCMKQIKPEEVFETVKLILKTGKDERFAPSRIHL
ncbi:MAG: glycosyltransferase family 9 protein [Candidatus Kryptoniota bacterium]